MTALFLSPHLDDAAFSAGTIIALLAAHEEVVVATVFTRSVASPQGFALTCQTDKGFAPEVDYMAIRRAEDEAACAILGARAVWLDLPEAPHRGYGSALALFGARREDDALERVLATIAPLVSKASSVYAPLGLGDHVDHHLVRDAVETLRPDRLMLWEDMPYALRLTERPPLTTWPDASREADDAADEAFARKLDACAAYRSQLTFQFGGEGPMREAFQREASRFGPIERCAAALLPRAAELT